MGLKITGTSFVSPEILHPHPSQREQDLAHSLSSRLNEAYQSLLHPLARAEYILEKNGLQTSETDQVEDMEFMANIMEAREVIDDATPEQRVEVETLIESNQRMFYLHFSNLVLFQALSSENITRTIAELTSLIEKRDWPRVKSATIRLRYLQGIDRAAKNWIDNNT
jgi:molecular chaperone HscB